MKSYFECQMEELVDYKMLEEGGTVLLYGRPAVGKTKTALEIIKYFCFQHNCKEKLKYNFLYIDLSGDVTAYIKSQNKKLKEGSIQISKEQIFDLLSFQKGKITDEYLSSLEIVKHIVDFCKGDKSKFVVIDSWQDLQDKGEWFVRVLLNLVYHNHIVLLTLSGLPRRTMKRKASLPNYKDLKEISGNMPRLLHGVRSRLAVTIKDENEVKYFIKQD